MAPSPQRLPPPVSPAFPRRGIVPFLLAALAAPAVAPAAPEFDPHTAFVETLCETARSERAADRETAIAELSRRRFLKDVDAAGLRARRLLVGMHARAATCLYGRPDEVHLEGPRDRAHEVWTWRARHVTATFDRGVVRAVGAP